MEQQDKELIRKLNIAAMTSPKEAYSEFKDKINEYANRLKEIEEELEKYRKAGSLLYRALLAGEKEARLVWEQGGVSEREIKLVNELKIINEAVGVLEKQKAEVGGWTQYFQELDDRMTLELAHHKQERPN